MKRLNGATIEVPVDEITVSSLNPRQFMEESALAELGISLKANGVIQPVILEPKPGGGYNLLIGKRRLTSTIKSGLPTVTAIIVSGMGDHEKLLMILTEQLHREDLTDFEYAWSFFKLVNDFKMSAEEIADRIGRSPQFVRRRIQLLSLPKPVQDLLATQRLGMTHVETLVSLATPEEQVQFAAAAVSESLTGDDLAMLVRQQLGRVPGSEQVQAAQNRKLTGKRISLRLMRVAGWLNVMSATVAAMPQEERDKVLKALDKLVEAATKFLTPQQGRKRVENVGDSDAARNRGSRQSPDGRSQAERGRRAKGGRRSRVHLTR